MCYSIKIYYICWYKQILLVYRNLTDFMPSNLAGQLMNFNNLLMYYFVFFICTEITEVAFLLFRFVYIWIYYFMSIFINLQ